MRKYIKKAIDIIILILILMIVPHFFAMFLVDSEEGNILFYLYRRVGVYSVICSYIVFKMIGRKIIGDKEKFRAILLCLWLFFSFFGVIYIFEII